MSKPKPYVPKLPLIYTKGKFSDWRRHDDCGTIRDSADMPVIQIRECLTSEESAEFREAKQDPCAAFGEQVVTAVNSHAALLAACKALLQDATTQKVKGSEVDSFARIRNIELAREAIATAEGKAVAK